jgi:hypothetical protein
MSHGVHGVRGMRGSFVAVLVRLYPAAWRSEYGAELTDILLAHPLGPRVIADVLWNGLRQRARAVEPCTILGLASMSVILTGFALTGGAYGRDWNAVLQPSSKTFPTVTVTFLASELYVLLLIGCGCWTHLRYGGKVWRSGLAAMTMSLLAGLPVMVGGVLMTLGFFSVRFVGSDLPPVSALAVLVSPLVRTPEYWMWGALGGQLGKWIARRRHGAGAIRPSA